MIRILSKTLKIIVALAAVAMVTVLGVRIYDSQSGPPLEPWHTYIPHELSRQELDKTDWAGYLQAEDEIFASVREHVTQKLEPEDRVPDNRYFSESPVYPGAFEQDWNRSYIFEPEGEPVGVAVFLHGLTDTPYSLRHIARRYSELGFLSIAIRMPAHGTVPAALTEIEWEDWLAATRLAVREGKRRAPSVPLHLVGFSNGGALALKYALDALHDESLTKPDRLVLISPMIGVTRFARFAGFAGLPAAFPAFVKAAWLSILPEFNPFKYNSFPINGARQSHRLTRSLQQQIEREARQNNLQGLAPVLTFQSVMDFTVSTRAVITALYNQLPANGSELVLFDINRTAKFGPLLRATSDTALARLLPSPPRNFRTTVITNLTPDNNEVAEMMTEAGSTTEQIRKLGLSYPREVYSLSHVALPFPLDDGLYGLHPNDTEDFGIHLGSTATRGEVGVLIVALDSLLRMSSNPFFSYMQGRIDEVIKSSLPATS